VKESRYPGMIEAPGIFQQIGSRPATPKADMPPIASFW
jgi:hypothetical protein